MVDRPKLPYPDGFDLELFYARFEFPNNRKIKSKTRALMCRLMTNMLSREELKT